MRVREALAPSQGAWQDTGHRTVPVGCQQARRQLGHPQPHLLDTAQERRRGCVVLYPGFCCCGLEPHAYAELTISWPVSQHRCCTESSPDTHSSGLHPFIRELTKIRDLQCGGE
jgi:hypothetical protein